MPDPATLFYEFGSFRLDPARHLLLRDGMVVPLSARALDVLLLLVLNAGQPLKREAMVQAVWAYADVEDANLTVAVSHLRKALGENGESQEFIETIPRVGYRFVATVREVCEESPSLIIEKRTLSRTVIEEDEFCADQTEVLTPVTVTAPFRGLVRSNWTIEAVLICLLVAVSAGAIWAIRARNNMRSPVGINSIAVLPFKVVGGDQVPDHLGLGIADALITRLSNIRELNVRSTSAVMAFEGSNEDSTIVGRKLSVDAVLEGSVFRVNDRFRVTVRLIKVADRSSVWATQFEKPWQDQLVAQDEIALQLVDALALNLSRGEKNAITKRYTESADAYQLYLKGRYHWNKRNSEGMIEAQQMFRDAIQKDPQFALAYAGLADTLATGSDWNEAAVATEKAIEIDPELAPAYASRGFLEMFRQRKWHDAEESLKKSIELDPGYATAHHWYATLLEIEGRNEEARSEFRRALQIDPLSYNFLADMGQAYYFAHDYSKAKEYCDRSLAIYPDFIFAHQYLSDIFLQTGDYDRAVAEMLRADQTNWKVANDSSLDEGRLKNYLEVHEALYTTQGIKGFLSGRLSPKEENSDYAYRDARINAFIGRKDEALADLELACRGEAFLVAFAKIDPIFDSLHAEPRYQEVIKKLGL
jgi:DNA-binding winged helix-turn-helix (wHTH) protein/TolB-like protein/cytochrome c-type biogenesis protein CcmH/NrfG